MLLKKSSVVAVLAALVALAVPSLADADPSPTPANCAASAIMFGACSITFPDTAVGDTSAVTVTVTADMGSDQVTPQSPADPHFAIIDDSCTGVPLDTSDSCSFTVAFTPGDDGNAAAHDISTNMVVETLQSMGMGSPVNLDATQHGSGAGGGPTPAGASITPSSFAFADTTAGESSASQTFTVTSTSPTVLYISPSVITGPDADDYTITNDGCAFAQLSTVGESCQVTVELTPPADADAGATAATLELPSGADPALSVALSGTVTPAAVVHHPALSAAPATVDAGSVTLGDHADQTFTYTNTGDVALALTGVTVGPGLVKTADTCSAATVAAGATCTVTVRWTASVAGPFSGDVTVNGDASATATLTGTAVAPSHHPELTADPDTVDLGRVGTGMHADATLTYTNTGDVALALTGVEIGTGLTKLADTCTGQTLAVSGTCTVTVRWAPTTDVDFSADVTVDGDAWATATLTGTGVDGPVYAMSVSPSALDAGQIHRDDTGTGTYTYTNTGNVDIVPTSVSTNLSPYTSIPADTCTGRSIAPGATCTVTIALRVNDENDDWDFDVTLHGPAQTTSTFHARSVPAWYIVRVTGADPVTAAAGDTAKLYVTFQAMDDGINLTGSTLTGDGDASVTQDDCVDRHLDALRTCSVSIAWRATSVGTHTATLALNGDNIRTSAPLTLTVTQPAPPPAPAQTQQPVQQPAPAQQQPTAQEATTTAAKAQLDSATKDLAAGKTDVRFTTDGGGTLKESQTTGIVMGDSGSSTTTQVKSGPNDTIAVLSDKATGSVAASIASSQASTIISGSATGGFTAGTGGFTALGAGTGGGFAGLLPVPGDAKGVATPVKASRAVAPAGDRIQIVGRKCAGGKCTLKLTHPKTPGVYVGVISVRSATTGKIASYRFVAVVPATLKAPSGAPRCVTTGQSAPVNSVTFGVSSGARLRWALVGASKQPAQPRGCAASVRWPKLTPSKKALASGTIAGTGTTRTTSLATLLPASRLAKLKPGFYAIAFQATAGKTVSPLAVWSFEVLPRETTLESCARGAAGLAAAP
jgi:hypothetical protein